jgi:S1-C subfamily serine protease
VKKFIVFFALCISYESNAQFHIFLGNESYGLIMSDSTSNPTSFLGTGFAIDSNIVVTCYHVYHDSPNKPEYFHNMMDRAIPITLVDSFPDQDIAVFKTEYTITKRPMKIRRCENLKIGDSVLYLAFNLRVGANQPALATITNIDSILKNGHLIKRISFNGDVIGGYSGGPVFARNGNVIALVTIGVIRRSDGKTISAVGYSVEPLLKKKNF